MSADSKSVGIFSISALEVEILSILYFRCHFEAYISRCHFDTFPENGVVFSRGPDHGVFSIFFTVCDPVHGVRCSSRCVFENFPGVRGPDHGVFSKS